MEISLCLLTWDEIEGCRMDVPRLDLSAFSQVFALDAGSQDGTSEFLSSWGIEVVDQEERGYNAAYIEALSYFTGDAVIFFHPKGTIDPDYTLQMAELLQRGFDLVIASRMLRDSVNEEDSTVLRPRKWFGQGLAVAASMRWNHGRLGRIGDPLHGFRGCSRFFASSLDLPQKGATADLAMVRHAYASRAKTVEFPVHESARGHGETHFPAWHTGKQLLRYLVS